jgi:hypothetical protein
VCISLRQCCNAAWDLTRPQPVPCLRVACLPLRFSEPGEFRKRPGSVSRLGDSLVCSIPGLAVAHRDPDFSRG